MSRFNDIEYFLEYFKKLYSQNPDFPISQDTFYYKLATYGLNYEELLANKTADLEILDFFNKWKSDFKNHPHLEVYNSSRQKSFLQFSNSVRNDPDCYKLYLNFPKDKMYKAVKDIFAFIADSNIETFSKVANKPRADSIVLRIPKKEDVMKVINYVNRNPFLVENVKKTNPFLPKIGIIGFAYDEYLSYNDTLSYVLSSYFKDRKANNLLSNVSLNDLKVYCNYLHKNLLYNSNYVLSFAEDSHIKSEIERLNAGGVSTEDVLTNFTNVIDFINMSLYESARTEDYFEKISLYINKYYKKQTSARFTGLIKKEKDNYKYFKEACDATLEKYGESQLINALKYGIMGNYTYFTNGGMRNLRKNLIYNVPKEDFKIYATEMLKELETSFIRN